MNYNNFIPKNMPKGELIKLKDNKEVIFAYEPKELKKISIQKATRFINDLVDEYTYIGTKYRKKMKDISRLIRKNISLVRKKQCVFVYALDYKKGLYKIAGKLMIIRETEKMDHIANLWISVEKNYRGLGLGAKLMKKGLQMSKKSIRGIKIIELGVQENNLTGIKLYERFGFKTVAILPNEFQWQPSEKKKMQYKDELIMHYQLKKF